MSEGVQGERMTETGREKCHKTNGTMKRQKKNMNWCRCGISGKKEK